MPIQIPITHAIEQALTANETGERSTVRALAAASQPADDALGLLRRLLEHKWYMSERMGRDVGLLVAAVDFFEHVQPLPRSGAATVRAPGRVRAGGPPLLANPVLSLERVLRDFTGALRRVIAIVLTVP